MMVLNSTKCIMMSSGLFPSVTLLCQTAEMQSNCPKSQKQKQQIQDSNLGQSISKGIKVNQHPSVSRPSQLGNKIGEYHHHRGGRQSERSFLLTALYQKKLTGHRVNPGAQWKDKDQLEITSDHLLIFLTGIPPFTPPSFSLSALVHSAICPCRAQTILEEKQYHVSEKLLLKYS